MGGILKLEGRVLFLSEDPALMLYCKVPNACVTPLQVADYGYVLETGDIVLEGPASELSGHPRVIETYLGLSSAAAAAP